MVGYEYRVIPAPSKGVKAKGVKTPEGRFAHTLEELMNRMGAEGWEYQRAETLPSTERAGLTRSATHWRHVLIFRRALSEPAQIAETAEPQVSWPAPAADFAPATEFVPAPGERAEAAAPGDDARPPRPTLVASRNDPADSSI